MKKKVNKIIIPKKVKWDFKEPKKQYPKKWYVLVSLFFLTLILISYFLLRSWSSILLFLIAYLALIFYTKRPREKIHFMINKTTVTIDDKEYQLGQYKSFYIKPNQSYYSIYLVPNKRFGTELLLQFKEQTGEKLVDFLNQHLLMEPYQETIVDQIIKLFNL